MEHQFNTKTVPNDFSMASSSSVSPSEPSCGAQLGDTDATSTCVETQETSTSKKRVHDEMTSNDIESSAKTECVERSMTASLRKIGKEEIFAEIDKKVHHVVCNVCCREWKDSCTDIK